MNVELTKIIEQGYHKRSYDKGLTVNAIRQNAKETILSVSSAPNYNLSWLAKPLNKILNLKCKKEHNNK